MQYAFLPSSPLCTILSEITMSSIISLTFETSTLLQLSCPKIIESALLAFLSAEVIDREVAMLPLDWKSQEVPLHARLSVYAFTAPAT